MTTSQAAAASAERKYRARAIHFCTATGTGWMGDLMAKDRSPCRARCQNKVCGHPTPALGRDPRLQRAGDRRGVLKRVQAVPLDKEIIVVDDGSTAAPTPRASRSPG